MLVAPGKKKDLDFLKPFLYTLLQIKRRDK